MYQPNLERVAVKIVRDALRIQRGEHTVIETRADALPFTELVAMEIHRVGGTSIVLVTSDELRYNEVEDSTPDQMAHPAAAHLAALEKCHHYITIGLSPAEPQRFFDVDLHMDAAWQQRRHIINNALSQPGRKWLNMEYPTRHTAESLQTPWGRLVEAHWKAIDVDYTELSERVSIVSAILEQAQTLYLTSPRGTDLVLVPGNRPIHKDDGYIRDFGSLPAGEVFFAPLEDSVSGRVVFDYGYYKGHRISDLEMTFARGVGTPVGAASGYSVFRERWDAAAGDKYRIGELGIGLNPEIRTPFGMSTLDKKVFGSVHLALGNNDMLGGTNHSNLHWDWIITRPTLVADDRVILQNGQFQI